MTETTPTWNAFLIFCAGFGLLVTSLLQASAIEGYPLEQLGERPKGRGLWSFLFYYVIQGKGVCGYDPIQGALAPSLRLFCHVSGWLIVSSGIVWALQDVNWGMRCSTVLYFGGCVIVHHVLPGVSIPEGPRAHKIQREPSWPNKTWEIRSDHRYATAQESHEITEAELKVKLTGEAAGRDIWTKSPSRRRATVKRVDEALVQELASGGRPAGFNPSRNPNSADKIVRAQLIREYLAAGGTPPETSKKPANLDDAIQRAVSFYSMLLTEDGHWTGDYGGPHFLMPGLIVVYYIMGQTWDADDNELMQQYIMSHQQTDGGWGTHIESPSTMFGTTLMYVALRLLGKGPDDPVCVKGREFLHANGGVLYTASWCKFYLCLLGVMEWDGHNSVPPEMWMLPNWFPFHPGRMWCHARMVYLPMGYLYGSRYVYEKAASDSTVQALRNELYCEDYGSIDWINTRHLIAPMDNYSSIPLVMKIAQNALALYETWSIIQPFKTWVRKHGLKFSLDYMAAEDLQTNFINIGPVNKVLNMLSAYDAAGRSASASTVQQHLARIPDFMWVAEDGMKMKGYNGSQCWDTSFAIQAIAEAGLLDKFADVSRGVWSYLERCQILSTEVSQATTAYEYESAVNRRLYYRHISEGGWPFSTSAHGWPISDCTGEGLKGVLQLRKAPTITKGLANGDLKPIGVGRLQKAVNVLLSYQNEDGGFATYENNRGYGWYESLNPSEVFGDIMIDYSYVECSMASLTALVDFAAEFPQYRRDEIEHAVAKGRDFLKSLQRVDGSWYGSWACCFCYGIWFGVEGLIKCGEPKESKSIVAACKFLLDHQRDNGGWGEDFTSCYDKSYAVDGMKAFGDEGSGVVNTSWALLALAEAKCSNVTAVQRGVSYLLKRQLPCGDWPQEGIAGVFNRACGITYTTYRNTFPIWALARCRAVYQDDLQKKMT